MKGKLRYGIYALEFGSLPMVVTMIGCTRACFYLPFFYYSLRMYMETAYLYLVLCMEYREDNLTLASIYYAPSHRYVKSTGVRSTEYNKRQCDTHRQKVSNSQAVEINPFLFRR